MGAGRVIVTLGAQGALLVGEGGSEHFPVARVKALDTTAAGDTFRRWLRRGPCARPLDEAAAIRFGQAAAAISVTRLGAQTSILARGSRAGARWRGLRGEGAVAAGG
ncbi:PfkB family carbohydrate kinase [Pseudomonas aeruginosa]|nr:PfkB family carbohydrate kinase [Pseudomonas aeruginosa]